MFLIVSLQRPEPHTVATDGLTLVSMKPGLTGVRLSWRVPMAGGIWITSAAPEESHREFLPAQADVSNLLKIGFK